MCSGIAHDIFDGFHTNNVTNGNKYYILTVVSNKHNQGRQFYVGYNILFQVKKKVNVIYVNVLSITFAYGQTDELWEKLIIKQCHIRGLSGEVYLKLRRYPQNISIQIQSIFLKQTLVCVGRI